MPTVSVSFHMKIDPSADLERATVASEIRYWLNVVADATDRAQPIDGDPFLVRLGGDMIDMAGVKIGEWELMKVAGEVRDETL